MEKCLNCGNAVISNSYKYCSALCSSEHKKKTNILKWLDDYTFGTAKGGGLKRFVRKYLITQAEGKCSKCGRWDIHPVTGNYIIEVDHIDGDAHNNSRSNLRVLCPQCHALSPFHRALNKKSSRVNRVKPSLKSV